MTFRVGNRAQYNVTEVGGWRLEVGGSRSVQDRVSLTGDVSRRYASSDGVVARIHAVAMTQPMPPLTTDTTAPNQLATRPASSSPSCGPPWKNTMLTPIIRPRR